MQDKRKTKEQLIAELEALRQKLEQVEQVQDKCLAEEALRDGEERFRTMANAIPQLAWIANSDGYIFWYNQRWYDFTGTAPEDMEGWGWQSVHDPKVLPQVLERWKASIATGQPFDMVFPLRRADGQFRQFLTRVMPLKDSNGKVIQWFGTNTDITERQHSEEALQRQQEELQIILDSVPAMIFYKDKENRFIQTNRALSEATGLPKEELEGKSIFDLYPSQADDYWKDDQEVMRSGNPKRNIVETLETPEGVRWVQTDKIPYRDIQENIIGVIGFAVDITERKQAEEALRETQRDLNRAQAVANTGSWRLDLRRNELLWSEQTYRMFGIAPDTPMTYEVFLSVVHPEDREFVDRKWTLALGGKPYDIEHRIVVGDTVKWVRERAELDFDPQGALLSGFGTVQDITERKRAEKALQASEARFRALFEKAAVGIALANLEGRIFESNAAFQELTGYSQGELRGKPFAELTHPDDLSENLELVAELWAGRSEHFRLEKRYIRKDGGVIWIRLAATLVRDDRGAPNFLVAMAENITERKRAEEALQKAHEELEQRVRERTEDLHLTVEQLQKEVEERLQAEKALSESREQLRYLASQLIVAQEKERHHIGLEMHDDLGQLLMVLKLQLRAVQRDLSAESVDIKADLEGALDSVNEIVERIRRLSKSLRPSVLEDMGLATGLKSLCEDFQKYHGLELSIDMDDVEKSFSWEHQILIYRIFQESLTNVAKHSGATGVTIYIKRQNGQVVFQMQDNGKGFDLPTVLTQSNRDRGLGLAALEERVRMLGGDLQLWSQPGQGTRIRFTVNVDNPNV